jgi:hypothetical protein
LRSRAEILRWFGLLTGASVKSQAISVRPMRCSRQPMQSTS